MAKLKPEGEYKNIMNAIIGAIDFDTGKFKKSMKKEGIVLGKVTVKEKGKPDRDIEKHKDDKDPKDKAVKKKAVKKKTVKKPKKKKNE